MKRSHYLAAMLVLACVSVIVGQSPAAFGNSSSPTITVAPIPTVSVIRGSKAPLEIALRVNEGFHVNSNRPNDELLLPTVVHLDPPEGIMIANVAYPEAEELALPFAGKDKLSVYSGNFEVTAEVHVTKTAPLGTQRVHGQVRYQACDNRRCFPPKTTPVEFNVTVVRPPRVKHHPYTAASPHIR